ncbi:zinc finger protein 91-like [Sitodiplosis mosellana]|uniref:zinc finger protein 91-like n=1 Tax=Sitodiplosis mosellana TaxID=263140 RepID=UPI002444D97B|nr:zinc finger protein 91-like [Sitodiplosis mosellana]
MSKELHATKCRACMFPLNTATNIVPIFKEYKASTILAHMIADTIHILPEPDDKLGGNVCKLCAEKIYAFYEFRLSYLESDKRLREMLHNYETNQRLTASGSDSVSSMSITDEDSSAQRPKLEKSSSELSNVYDRIECHECGQCFERELQLRIHLHTHRNETPSHNTDSQNGFDEQFLLATIKSEPVEYELDPMDPMAAILDWPDTTQSDADNSSLQHDDEMRWKCTICEQRFLRRAHLRSHRRQHAVDRNNTSTTSSTITAVTATIATVSDNKPNEKKSDKKTIPPTHKHDKSSVNLLKKKYNLNVTADAAQFERWQCKKCFSTFRTRRLLRDHNVVHRNSSLASLDFDSSLLNDSLNPNEPSIIHFDADSDAAVAAATAAAAAIDVRNYIAAPPSPPPPPQQSPKKMSSSPKSQSTPLKMNTSSSESAKWKCPKCRKAFETPKQLRKHKLAAHTFEIKLNLKSKNFISERKSVSFSELTTSSAAKKRKLEARSQFVERDWPCSSCHQVFSRRNQLREHRRTAHMLKPMGALPISISMKQELGPDDYAVAD